MSNATWERGFTLGAKVYAGILLGFATFGVFVAAVLVGYLLAAAVWGTL